MRHPLIYPVGLLSFTIMSSCLADARQQTYDFTLPAAPMADTLLAIGERTGQQVLFLPEDVKNLTSNPIEGNYTTQEALRKVFDGTGRVPSYSQSGSLRVTLAARKHLRLEDTYVYERPVLEGASGQSVPPDRAYTLYSSESVTGLDLPLKDTPQSVTVVTQEQIRRQGLDNLSEIVNYTTGLSTERNGALAGGYEIIHSRGSELHNFTVDGLPVSGNGFSGVENTGIGTLSSAIYDNVTIVRGATGLMNGIGDPSGMVALNRKRPTRETSVILSQGFGSRQSWQTQLDASGPLGHDGSTRARAVVDVQGENSWQDNADARSRTFYGVVEHDFSPDTLVTVGFEHQNGSARASAMHAFQVEDTDGNPTHFGRSRNSATDWTRYEDQHSTLFAALEQQLNDTWRARMNYSFTRSKMDQLYGVATQEITAGSNESSLNAGYREAETDQHAVGATLTADFDAFGQSHQWILGSNYYRVQSDGSGVLSMRYPIADIYRFDGSMPIPDWQANPDFEMMAYPEQRNTITQLGAYTASRISLTERLSTILGARISRYSDDQSTTYLDGFNEHYSIRDNSVVTPYLGLTYQFTPDWSGYLSYTSIYNPQYYKDIEGRTLEAEKGENYELGFKSSLLQDRLSVNAAVYHIRKQNMAFDTGEFTPHGDYAYETGEARGTGWEVEMHGMITDAWRINTGYSYLRLEDRETSSLARPYIPKQQFKLFSSYEIPLAGRPLTLGAGVRWQSETYSRTGIVRDNNTQDAYTLTDFVLGYEASPRLGLQLKVANLFDKTYRLDPGSHTYGEPRSTMFTLRYALK
ncbi:MAG: TonB-dependent siderophore receptor [Pseudomonas sp.]